MEPKMYFICTGVNYVLSESDIEDGGSINPDPNDFGIDTKEEAVAVLQRLTDYCRQKGYEIDFKIEEHSPVCYRIQDRETGTLIDEFDTYEESLAKLKSYERDDKNNGDYTPNFYEIKPIF